jgi:hypothetical protein
MDGQNGLKEKETATLTLGDEEEEAKHMETPGINCLNLFCL